jgi:hypothetical protein
MANQTMAEEAVELFVIGILFTFIIGFCLGLCHLVYVAHCNIAGQHSSEENTETTRASFHVTEEDIEMV